MKKLINNPENVVPEMIQGLAMAYAGGTVTGARYGFLVHGLSSGGPLVTAPGGGA